MKILFLTTEYSSCKLPDCGGLGTFIKVLSEELVTTGNQVLLLGFAKKDITFFDNEIKVIFKKNYFKKYPVLEIIRSIASSLKFTSLEKLLSKKERIYYAKVLKNIANNEKVDIIEAHAFNGLSAMWDNSIPLVVRFHGSRGFWHKYLGKKNEPIKMYFEKEALLNTPNIIAVSKFSSQAINAIYDLNLEPKIIYNGIDINLFSSKYNVDEIPKSIFYVGTLSDAKGLNVLCAIFNKIIEIHPDATLHLIGRGKEYFETKMSKILTDKALGNVVYYGGKQLAEIPPLLQKASVCIYPSINETFGLVYAEAMAMKKVVIASNNLVVNEIIKHQENGFIANDIDDYINYINLIFTDEKLKTSISENARIEVINRFDKVLTAKNTLKFYNEILQR